MANERLVWLDLEMTGLDESTCTILQVAMIITDPGLQEIASADIAIWQPDSSLNEMVPFVREMHTKNGLLKRVRASSVSLKEAQEQLMGLLAQHVGYRKGFLAGNSIYADRRFLQKYMTMLESYLHYRQVDVSSLKILCQEWFGEKGKPPKKVNAHTALEDIRESIEELKFYRAHCFKDRA